MAKFRVTFPGDAPDLDFTGDRMEASGNGVRIYRKDDKDVEQQVAYFTAGSYVACFEIEETA